jgi:hypothetical protein
MPGRSRSQMRFMFAVQEGKAKVPGLSKKEAADFTKGVDMSKLPEKVKAPPKKKRTGG